MPAAPPTWSGRIDVGPPDLTPHAPGDPTLPWTWHWSGPAPGPHVAIVACVHGNEVCGAHALDALLRAAVRPRRGRLSLVLANPAAFGAFDPDQPFASRFVDEDMNRVWTTQRLDGPGDSVELRRARALRPLFDEVDVLLDLHSMHTQAPPVAMAGRRDKGVSLAHAIGVPGIIVRDEGHADGVRLRDFGAFDDPASPRRAVLVECGQHFELGVDRLALEVCWRLLRATGTVSADDVPLDLATPPPQRVVEVVGRIDLTTDDYRFVRPFRGGEVLASGEPILEQAGQVQAAPFDDCMLVMPTTGLAAGQTAVRLARPCRDENLPEPEAWSG